uniref:hypothetical protein n=1 Tax=uncultured Dokdonia sp. TaxID=575653 RepID=UPI00262557BB
YKKKETFRYSSNLNGNESTRLEVGSTKSKITNVTSRQLVWLFTAFCNFFILQKDGNFPLLI